MIKQYDIVIVGTGIAGLSTILYLTETEDFKKGLLSIAIIAKDKLDCTNTNWAQGGIAAVKAIGDNFENHIQDTLVAGAFKNKENIVRKVVQAGPTVMEDLIRWGTRFDIGLDNEFDLAKEGGHSASRIWHYKDQTGYAIEQALLSQLTNHPLIHIFEYNQVVQVEKIAQDLFQLKLFHLNQSVFQEIQCSKLVLATGGLGMLYNKTTNQKISSGDGIYFAKQLGAKIKDISLIQFHPTGLYQEGNSTFLISEALRGAGAVLRNVDGIAFMSAYDTRADLAPRDIVSRAILQEMQKTISAFVFLDATQIDKNTIENHFPSIKNQCLQLVGINIETDFIPVVPVQHYACGGIEVNEYGESSISNLFAIGEVAYTGLHGANRLASNSLLEAIAFAKFSIRSLLGCSNKTNNSKTLKLNLPLKNIDIQFVRDIMSKYAGVVKTNKDLMSAIVKLKTHLDTAEEIHEFNIEFFQNTIIINNAIDLLEDALAQKENKGVHYNLDLL